MKRIRYGFTIAELLVVIVIIATFALLSYFGFHRLKDKSFNEGNKTNAEAMLSALKEIYNTGATAQGATGEKATYLDVKTACANDGQFFKDIINKQTNISNDVEVLMIEDKKYPDVSIEYSLSNAIIQKDGTVIPKNESASMNIPTRLFTCSSAPTFVNPYQQSQKTYLVYQPLSTYDTGRLVDHSQFTGPAGGWVGYLANNYCYDKERLKRPNVSFEPQCTYFNLYYINRDGSEYKLVKIEQ